MARKRMESARSAKPRLRSSTGGSFAGVLRDWLWPRLVGIVVGLVCLIAYGLAAQDDIRIAQDQAELTKEIRASAQHWAVRE